MSTQQLLNRLQGPRADGEAILVRAPEAARPVQDFAESVVEGLSALPKWLDCTFLYDARGSELFERICQQPEYYLTRTEAALLREHARDIAAITGSVNLVELGSGYSVKTKHILNAYLTEVDEPHYVPIDVSQAALHAAREAIARSHPDVLFSGIIGTYESAFPLLDGLSPAMVIFLGSTIGNMDEAQARAFFEDLAHALRPGDYVLLGVDLAKEAATLEAAYNDAAGVTAAFTLNLFARMNRELGSGVDLETLRHVAAYNPARKCIETFVEFTRAQHVRVAPLGRTFHVSAGERIAVEISRKFELAALGGELAQAGLTLRRTFTDQREWFALLLLQRTAAHD